MPEREKSPDSNKVSVDILTAVGAASYYGVDPEDPTRIRFYNDVEDQRTLIAGETYPIADFFEAVDFYCANRASQPQIQLAMAEGNGMVPVYNPDQSGTVSVEIPVFAAYGLLESSYQFLKSKKEIK